MRSLLPSLGMTVALSLIAAPGTAVADNVLPGDDLFASVACVSYQDFSGPFTIPADFFDPGSEPFSGRVFFRGDPLGSYPGCFGDLGNTDTIVRRLDTAILPAIGSFDQIPIEIVSLSLVSCEPITVNYVASPPELWDLRIAVSPSLPSTGSMTITHSLADGGTFSAQFTVYPLLTFTRVSDQSVRVLDAGPFGLGDTFLSSGVPWRHDALGEPVARPSCVSNFVASYDGAKVFTQELAQLAAHGVVPACPSHPNAVAPTSWGTIKGLYR